MSRACISGIESQQNSAGMMQFKERAREEAMEERARENLKKECMILELTKGGEGG